ncbi:hypothetical protein ACJJIQ_10535 [Microbulbifer sp. ANSA003]|uniref:hypothetical protein n=1 Tax=Microbulbifer sp. ANSA003 TaxID=3243360 RepID=UPI00404123B7
MNKIQTITGLTQQLLEKIEERLVSFDMTKVDSQSSLATGQYRTWEHTDSNGIKTYQIEWMSASDLVESLNVLASDNI